MANAGYITIEITIHFFRGYKTVIILPKLGVDMIAKNKIIITFCTSAFILVCTLISGFYFGIRYNERIVHIDWEVNEKPVYDINRYPFLEKDWSDYIVTMSNELGIDPDLAVAIMLVEDPDFNVKAIHINDNGTTDLGIFQLNDSCLYRTFLPRYWKFKEVEFNAFNWKHNTYIALHHIKYLTDCFKKVDDVIMAYNGGEYNVLNGTVKPITRVYLARVKNNYQLLKEGKK